MHVIGERLEIDGTHVGQIYDEDPDHWRMTHQWVRKGVQPPSLEALQRVPRAGLPWVSQLVFAGEASVIPDVEALPPEAVERARALPPLRRALGGDHPGRS